MSIIFIFGMYLLIGFVVDLAALLIVWGLVRKYAGNEQRYRYLFRKHSQKAYDYAAGYPHWARILFTQLLWPLNTYNTFRCGIPAIKEAREENADE